MGFISTMLADNVEAWDRIGVSETVRKWILEGVPVVFVNNEIPNPFEIRNNKFSKKEYEFLRTEIQSLLKLGALEKCSVKPAYLSPIKCVPKKKNKFRLVADLSHFNDFVETAKFQYETNNSVSEIIEPNDYMINYDLKNGFFCHVPILKEGRQYFGFKFGGSYYRWCVCPFGWSSSPYYFHKVLRPVSRCLRDNNVKNSLFLDDGIVSAKQSKITDHCDFTVHTLEDLGFRINYDKSCLIPSTEIVYVGFLFNSVGLNNQPWIYMTNEKIRSFKKDVHRSLKKGVISARFLAKICGRAIAMSKAILPGKLKLRPLYALLSTRRSWADVLIINETARETLTWWTEAINSWNGSPLRKRPIEAQIWTDSSDLGLGCVYLNNVASGVWDSEMVKEHINFKELLTVLYALLCFGEKLRDKAVRVMCYNMTAVAYVRNMGGPISK